MTDLTALTEITTPTTDDLVYVVDAPTGAKNPRKCSIANFHAVNDARTKTLTNTTIDADGTGNSITNIDVPDLKSGVLDTDLTAVSASDDTIPSAKAVKTYVDASVASDITLKGAYNANTNSPNLDSSPTAGTILKGDHYVVSVAGTFYTESLQEGDSLISEVDNPSAITDWIITNNNLVTPITDAQVATGANIAQSKIASLTTDLSAKAPLVSPAFTTPNLGTPSAGTLTSCTGLPIGGLVTTGTPSNSTYLRGDGAWSTVDSSPLTTKGDVYVFGTGNTRLPVGADGLVLKADSSTATGLVWGSGGGGATIVHTYTNTTNTSYTGTASSFGTVGVGDRDIYIKKIDANNEGVFTKIWKNGSAVEVQIA